MGKPGEVGMLSCCLAPDVFTALKSFVLKHFAFGSRRFEGGTEKECAEKVMWPRVGTVFSHMSF